MAIYLPELSAHDVSFPALHRALVKPDGLLAMGGDLSVPRLVSAYSNAVFPWFDEGEPLLWWSPSIRAAFAPDSLMLNRTLRKQIQRHQLSFSLNTAFSQVVAQCAAPRPRQPSTWILPEMQQAYLQLHLQGYAHSIEVWQQDTLVGGLYGVLVGSLFCGESMFNRLPDTAKLALVVLQQHLQQVAAGWIDCQLPNPFLMQLGAKEIPRSDYVQLLLHYRQQLTPASHWQARSIRLDSSNA